MFRAENEVHDLTNDPRHTTPSASAYPPEASTPCDSSCYLSSHPETPDVGLFTIIFMSLTDGLLYLVVSYMDRDRPR